MVRTCQLNVGTFTHLYKVASVDLFKRDLQVKYDVISSGDVSILLLSVASKHETEVAKETTHRDTTIVSQHCHITSWSI